MALLSPRTITPTADDLCREAYQTIAGREPTADKLLRMATLWVEEGLLDVWQFATHNDITRFKALENSAVLVLTKGRRRYDFPEDWHRPIAATLLEGTLTGTVATDTADGDLVLAVENDGDLEDYDYGDGYALSGRYLVISSGEAEGEMREIVSVDEEGPPAELTIDAEWLDGGLPEEGDTFFIATVRGQWVDEEMREHQDRYTSRPAMGVPVSFNEFDRTLELDVAPDSTTYALLIRYWSHPCKVNKESTVMQQILVNWRNAIMRYMEWRTARDIDDSRVNALKKDYEDARLALMENEYDRGPAFDGFRPYR